MRLRALPVIIGLLVVASCGSKSATSSATSSASSAAASGSPSSAATSITTSQPAPSTTAAAVTAAPTTTASSSGSPSAFCDAARRQVTDLPAKFQELIGGGDAAGWLAYADEAQKNNDEIGRLAPAEIRDAVKTITPVSAGIVKAIRDAGGDFTKVTPALSTITATVRTPEYKAASDAMNTYLKSVCGLDVAAALTAG